MFQSGLRERGTVSAILGKDDFMPSAELNHASIIDVRGSLGRRSKSYRHKDTLHAEELLEEVAGEPGHKLIITDACFHGCDIGPLPALCDLRKSMAPS